MPAKPRWRCCAGSTNSNPYINVYRSYSAPNFKVTVGSFRNRVEAQRMLDAIKDEFPDAFIVRDKFRYPSIGDPECLEKEGGGRFCRDGRLC